jgi:hypothetical protein
VLEAGLWLLASRPGKRKKEKKSRGRLAAASFGEGEEKVAF